MHLVDFQDSVGFFSDAIIVLLGGEKLLKKGSFILAILHENKIKLIPIYYYTL